MARYRIALVGCGDIAETGHLPALLEHPRFEVAALCDVRMARLETLRKKAPASRIFEDYRALLKDPSIDAVILALHPEVSVNVAIEFLRAGKPVLGEKPLARSLEDGLRLQKEIEKTGGVYQIGFVFRYCSTVKRLSELAHEIGTPAFYRIAIYDERLDRTNTEHFQRIQRAIEVSSAITHEGSHPIDFMQQLNASAIVATHANAVKTSDDFKGPNLWSAQFKLADGSAFNLEIGWFIPDVPRATIMIAGPRGALEVDLRTGQGTYQHGGKSESVQLDPLLQNWRGQLDNFLHSIETRRVREATIEDGLRALRATTECERLVHRGDAKE
jgi:predicted dehydrogenase